MQFETGQVLIAADKRIGTRGARESDEVVIVRVAADRRDLVWILNEFRMVPDGVQAGLDLL